MACRRALIAIGCFAVAVGLPAAGASDTSREQLHATLWMQTSAEYRAAVEQVFRLATGRLSEVMQPGTAALEQQGMDPRQLASLPTAIIVDLDETILDNSYYQARLVRERREYDEGSWQAWMQEARAPVLPGALEFLDAAAHEGHRIFYLTNRACEPAALPPAGSARANTTIAVDPCPAKTATQRNLIALGLPGGDDPDALLLRNERPE